MTTPQQQPDTGWLQAFLAVGQLHDDHWEPLGGSVLLIDHPIVWLVTASTVAQSPAEKLGAWVPTERGPTLVDLTALQRQNDIDWIHHPAGVSATPFPVDPTFQVKAFTEPQCTRVGKVKAMMPAVTAGRVYGAEADGVPSESPAMLEGIVSIVNQESGHVFATAPLLPNNAGSPLLLASPYGGPITLAGLALGSAMLHDNDPRALPVRLTRAICVDAVLELIRGKDARAVRAKVAPAEAKQPPAEDSRSGDSPTANPRAATTPKTTGSPE